MPAMMLVSQELSIVVLSGLWCGTGIGESIFLQTRNSRDDLTSHGICLYLLSFRCGLAHDDADLSHRR
jgi:hypothetical protein